MFLKNILEKCRATRRPSSAQQREWEALARSAAPPRDFLQALQTGSRPRIIAEFKRASPSAGTLREDADPRHIATLYAAGRVDSIATRL